MQARPARGEELADRRVGPERLEQLDVALADLEQDCLDALPFDGFAVLLAHPEAVLVQLDRSVEIVDCDSDVVDASEHGGAAY